MKTKEFIEERIAKLEEYMFFENIGVALISSPENLFYFSNFNPIITSKPSFIIIRAGVKPCLLVPAIRKGHALADGSIENVQFYGKWGENISEYPTAIDALYEIVGVEIENIGIEFNAVSINLYKVLQDNLKPKCFIDISKKVWQMRLYKDTYELDCIKKAANLTDIGISMTIEGFKKGESEAVACTEGQYAMRKFWQANFPEHEVAGFANEGTAIIDSCTVWSMANKRITYGCDCPQPYKAKQGDLLLPMAWAKISGYSAETERSIICGKNNTITQKAYISMLRARNRVFKILKPGITCTELYINAVKVFEEDGFFKNIPNRIGHGIGLAMHESPSLAYENQLVLRAGMVITIEPGLMDINWGGVRHSDTVVITEDGFEFLTKLERGYIII